MADSTAATRKPLLVYNEENFPVFSRLLFSALIENDRSNKHLLVDNYEEAKLPEDPIRAFVRQLTPNQKTSYNARSVAADITIPTKLQVLEDPEDALVTAWETWIQSEVEPDHIQVRMFRSSLSCRSRGFGRQQGR